MNYLQLIFLSLKGMCSLEATDEIDDGVASLFPVDLETVAVLVVVIEILDVFEKPSGRTRRRRHTTATLARR